jgi:hypothetical protein
MPLSESGTLAASLLSTLSETGGDARTRNEVHMMTHRILATAATIALLPVLTASCGPTVGGGSGGSGTSGSTSTSGSGGGQLKWYTTCGDPVCDSTMPPSMPLCTTEKDGDPCTTADKTCGIENGCGADLLCTTADPKASPGGCPISLARYKHDIRYLPDADLQRIHDDLIATPLTTWRYNHDAPTAREHLGFIIDDNPKSPAVAESGDQVNLYGYTSMAVAAIQVQQKQIEALQQETRSLREELRSTQRACAQPRPHKTP